MHHQRSLIPSVCSLNSQEDEYNEYANVQKKLQGYKDTLKLISKANEEDRKQLAQSHRSQNSLYNTDILQLTESQEEDQMYLIMKENEELKKQIQTQNKELQSVKNELAETKRTILAKAQLLEDISGQRDQLYIQVQQLKEKPFNHTLLDITYDHENTCDQSMVGRKRTRSGYHQQKDTLLSELQEILQTENVIKEVYDLKSQNKRYNKFVNCLQDMIQKLTPKQAKTTPPSLKDCWHWIKKFLNEYMLIKKSMKTQLTMIDQLKNILNVEESEIVSEIQILVDMLLQNRQ